MSEFDIAARVIPLLAGAFASFKVGFDTLMHSRVRLRDEYRFAKEFLADMKSASPMHPLLREKGLQALAGTDGVSANEVEYLLNLPEPASALKDYAFARNFLDHHATAGESEISFKCAWRSQRKRWIAKAIGLALYVVLFMTAMSPLFLPLFTKEIALSAQLLLVTVPVFGAMAFLVLMEAVRIARAERLVGLQIPRRGFRLVA
jgi:hypothetical protein